MLQVKKQEVFGDTRIMTHETEWLSQEAKIAIEMASRWGMVASVPDGEDSAGRQKLRLMSPEELALRALDTVECLMSKARARGFVVQGPDITELKTRGEMTDAGG